MCSCHLPSKKSKSCWLEVGDGGDDQFSSGRKLYWWYSDCFSHVLKVRINCNLLSRINYLKNLVSAEELPSISFICRTQNKFVLAFIPISKVSCLS